MEGSRSPSLWWRKRLRSFGETTDISEYPHRGIEWCAATAPLVPRRASRPPPDRTRYASECDAVRYVTLWTTIAPRSPSPHLSLHRLGPGAILFVWLGMRSGTKAQPAWRLQVESGWEQTSRNRVLPGQCVTTESQPRRGLI